MARLTRALQLSDTGPAEMRGGGMGAYFPKNDLRLGDENVPHAIDF
jgi:hypothetical protein